jgi:WD40 repeat protein
MSPQETARKTKIFISYSRKNISFVRKLNDALDATGIEAWVDWEGIPPSADWMEEIKSATRAADAFVFVISPQSLASQVCAEELDLCLQYNKKLVPILYAEPEKGTKMHPKLKSTNWVNMRPKKDDFEGAISKVLESIQTDLEWVQRHTRLLQRANEWMEKRQNGSYLLRGSELEESQRWMAESTAEGERIVLPLQAEYITASRKAALNRLRVLIVGIGLAFLLSVALGVFALQQRDAARRSADEAKRYAEGLAAQKARADKKTVEALQNMQLAEQSEKTAQAQRSAALAKIYQSKAAELDTSTLLAVNSCQQIMDLSDAEDILRQNISLLAFPVSQQNVGAEINKIQRNRDRTKFVTADAGGKACVWSMADGSQFFCTKQQGSLSEAAFSSDGKILVTASDLGDVILWAADTGAKLKSFHYNGKILDLNVAPKDSLLGMGRSDGYGLIDMNSMTIAYDYEGPDVRKIDIDPFGKYMALAMADGDISLWEMFTSNTPAGLKHKSAMAVDVTYSPDGRWVVSAGTDGMARVLDVRDGRTYSIVHGDSVQFVAFGPDDSWFVTVSDDGFVRVIDTMDKNQNTIMRERVRMAQDNFVTRARVSSDGQWIASTGYDRTVRVWDAFSGAEVMRIPISDVGSAVEFNSDASRLIVGDRRGHITLWDTSRLKARTRVLQFPEFVREARFSPDGKWIVANTDDGKVSLIASDLMNENDDQRRELPGIKGLTSKLAVSKDSKWIAAVQYDNVKTIYNVVVIPVDNPAAQFTLDARPINAVAFTPDNQLVTAGDSGAVIVWDIASRKEIVNFNSGGVSDALAVSPDGKYLAAGVAGGDIVVWNLSTRAYFKTLEQFGAISSLQFSPDGKLLATGSSESLVALWNVADDSFSRVNYDLRTDSGVSSMEFSPKNDILAVGDSKGLVFLFDIVHGEEAARLRHANKASSVSFSPDGTQLAVASQKGVDLWDMTAILFTKRDQLIESACARMTHNLSHGEWANIFPNEQYRLICPDLPAGEN